VNLTDLQLQAVNTTSHDTLVIAGAGSGKTRVLTERIYNLLTVWGASPSELLVLTFTRKAAGELIGRLKERFSDTEPSKSDALKGMLIGTFHSVALRILMAEGEVLGFRPRELTVLPVADADMLLKRICQDFGYYDGKRKWKAGWSWDRIERYRESVYTQSPMGIDSESDTVDYAKIMQEYFCRCKELNALDFGQILMYANRLFVDFPQILERYRRRIKYVLVDELQDSDLVQYNLHDHFAPPAEFFGVGDTRQSIYGFRGARPDLMVKRHPDATVVNLVDCFRCGDKIVFSANRLIGYNAEPLAEPMVGATGRAGKVSLVHGRSASLAAVIKSLDAEFYGHADIVCLARSHRILKRLEEICQEYKIPAYRVGKRFDLCETDGFQLLHACLRLCANPDDNLAFLHLLGIFKLGNTAYATIRAQGAAQHLSHFRTLIRLRDDDPEIPVVALARQISNLSKCNPGPPFSPLPLEMPIAELCRGIWPDLCASDSWTGEYSVASELYHWWMDNCATMSLQEALHWYALRDSQEDVPEQPGDHVTLMTVHAAKGLEWPAVILFDMEEGTFPASRAVKEEDGLKEERRLAYVAATRAIERLIVHYREQGDQAKDRGIQLPSRFVGELGLTRADDDANPF
jgi:superfamily I DNA/RNA helicase